MAEIKEITSMCRAGNVQKAYELAKADLAEAPTDPWTQREVGWALYYMIKGDVETNDYDKLLEHIDELKSLEQLSIENDCMIFDNVQFKIAEFVRNRMSINDYDASNKLSAFFSRLRNYNFKASRGHSYLLQSYIKFEMWSEMADFLSWWNLDNLSQDDYTPYVNSQGQKMMTLAERAYIANAKALLKLNDAGRIEEFLPKLYTLMMQHDEMMYPGYFYGKLLLALGSDADEALKVIVPFARKKATEFWVWQLLSDVFADDEEKQLACLLRAVHCRTQETFLGKVRIKLAALYIRRNQLNYARHHIDMVVRCYASHGWRLPQEIDLWIHQNWIHTATADATDIIDYKAITDEILCNGAEECIAVVTYIDQNSHRTTMIYDKEKILSQKLRFKTNVGNVLKLHYVVDKEGKIKVLSASKISLPDGLNYAKYVEGTIEKKDDKDFAFLRAGTIRCFVSPTIVKNNKLNNGDNIRCLIAYDFNKKKSSWNWVCVSLKGK